jgi:outer membrane protein TolC
MNADATRKHESLPALPRLVYLCGLLLLLAPPAARAVGDDGTLASIPRIEVGEVITARPGVGEVLDLTTCVGIALERNDALRAVRLRRKELDGQMYQALSTGLPTIDASGGWSRGRDPTFALDESFGGGDGGLFDFPPETPDWFRDLFGAFSILPEPSAIPAQTYYRTSLNLSWTINPLKVLGAVGAANLGIHRQDLAIQAAEHQTAEATIGSYHGIILAAEQLAAVEARVANQREFLEVSKLRFDLGMATDLDTLQAAVALANTQPDLRLARQGLRNAGARLNALMSRPPESPLAVRNEQVIERDQLNTERALELAVHRPELEQVALFSDILRRNRQAQKADMRPYISVDGAYGYVGRDLNSLTDKGHDFWQAAVALNVPLFDGLLTKGKVEETEASIRRTDAELADQRRQVRVQVLELLTNLETARQNLRAAELNLQRAEEALDRMIMEYRLGRTDYLSALDAEANRSQARSNLIQARYEVLTLTASLKRAVGYSPLLPLTAIEGLVQGDTE